MSGTGPSGGPPELSILSLGEGVEGLGEAVVVVGAGEAVVVVGAGEAVTVEVVGAV
jgi:hypothetical protein